MVVTEFETLYFIGREHCPFFIGLSSLIYQQLIGGKEIQARGVVPISLLCSLVVIRNQTASMEVLTLFLSHTALSLSAD